MDFSRGASPAEGLEEGEAFDDLDSDAFGEEDDDDEDDEDD